MWPQPPLSIRLLLQHADAPERLVALVEGLSADLEIPPSPPSPPRDSAKAEPAVPIVVELFEKGFASLGQVGARASCVGLVSLIERLAEVGLPAVFVFAHDAVLELGACVERRVSRLLARSYVLIEDVWAWRIPPGKGGWPPHRGVDRAELDRHAPEVLNIWVALSDVPVDRSCMHFVPLHRDPHYPAALMQLDHPANASRAVPIDAGTALAWNANVLHWGGACALDAEAPRVSCSFSLGRADALDELRQWGLGPARPSFASLEARARMDLIASQIVTYGDGQPDVSNELLTWARATCALRAHIRAPSRKEP